MCVLRACLAIGFSVMATAAVAEERRELGPHEHGTGRLVVAIEGNRISMALDAPGADVVVVHVRTGSCDIDDGDAGTVRLGPGDSAWWVGGAGRVPGARSDGSLRR